MKEAVRRAEERHFERAGAALQTQAFCVVPGKIGLPSPEGIEYIPLSKIVSFEAHGNLTKIWLWLEARPRAISHHLGWFEKQLECGTQNTFFRTHNAYIANRDYVRFFRHEGKKAALTMHNNTFVRVSEDRKAAVLEWLNNIAG